MATFSSLFESETAAEGFRRWVTRRDGRNLVEPLLWHDPMICGAKVKQAAPTQLVTHCSGGGQDDGDDPAAASSPSPDPTTTPSATAGSRSAAVPSTDVPTVSEGATTTPRPTNASSSAILPPETLVPDELPLGANVSARLSTRTNARSASVAVCNQVFTVRWDLRILAGYINQESAVAGSGYWSPAADEHFYSVTNVLLRMLTAHRMEPGTQPDSDAIKLSSAVTHSVGRIGSFSDCPRGVLKHVQYEFSFSSRRAALIFRDWLKPDDSREVARSLRTLDPSGVCGAAGAAGAVQESTRCALPEGAAHKFGN